MPAVGQTNPLAGIRSLYNELSSAHPVKPLFPAQAALAAVLAAGSLTAAAQTRSADTAATNRIDANGVSAAVDPHKYEIGAEDVLFIKVWREPDFTFAVSVRPDGKITVPLIGEFGSRTG